MDWRRKRLEALKDEDLNDVCLVGRDGEEVACSKLMLAAQSAVFKKMFFGSFKERQSDRCVLEFHSVIIKMIVEYCYLGELDILPYKMGYSGFTTAKSAEERASFLVELRDAGRYFALEDVREKTERKIGECVFEKCDCPFARTCLTELFKRGEDDGPLWNAIFEFVVANPERCFGNLSDMSADTTCRPPVSLLIKILEKLPDPFIVAQCLQSWTTREDKQGGGGSDEENQALVNFCKSVDLRKLSAKQLSLLFKGKQSSAVFTSERILDAVFHQFDSEDIESSVSRRTKERFYVSGAGMEDLNGFYAKVDIPGEEMNIFLKGGHYDDRNCLFLIHHCSRTLTWRLSIIEKGYNLISRGEISRDDIYLDAYEADWFDESSVPFNGWKCLEGNGPAPIVARIDG